MLSEEQVAAMAEDGPRLTGRMASTVVPVAPEWVWNRWLLAGALNLLVARQGAGKTTFAAHLTAALTRGQALPGDVAREPMTVAFLSLEEPDDRVVARLHAAGADLARVVMFGDVIEPDDEGHIVRRRWQLPKDIAVLEEATARFGAVLVIIDGLGYSITGDSHNYAVVGSALAALAGAAERSAAAVLGLVHPPKGASDPVTAAIGSTAWTAIPRVSMVLGLDPNDETKTTRVVSVGKTNYREPDSSLAFTIDTDPTFECGYVVGLRPTSVSAEDVMAAPATQEERTERADARAFLGELLADGPMDAKAVDAAAAQAGIAKRTLFRARKDLGVVSAPHRSEDNRAVAGWTLSLPGATVPSKSATVPSLDSVGTLGTLDTHRTNTLSLRKDANAAGVALFADDGQVSA